MKKNNQGFSLVELIVTIAIMAVALTVGSYALSSISLANSKRCATEMKTALEAARLESSRRDEQVYLEFFVSDGSVMMQVNGENAEEIGNSSVTVSYKAKTDVSYKTLSGTAKLRYEFDRSSGAMKQGYEDLIISGGGREYKITCYKSTGKIKME